MTLLLLLGQGVTTAGAPTYIPVDTGLMIVPPTLRIRARNYELVPYLTDEAGNILLAEDGQPLIDESQVARLKVVVPALKVRKVQ